MAQKAKKAAQTFYFGKLKTEKIDLRYYYYYYYFIHFFILQLLLQNGRPQHKSLSPPLLDFLKIVCIEHNRYKNVTT